MVARATNIYDIYSFNTFLTARKKKHFLRIIMIIFKGTMSRDFQKLFFCLKDSTWTPYEQTKTVFQTFSFSQRYTITIVSLVQGVFIFLNYCYRGCINIYELFFRLNFSRLSSRKQKKILETVFACPYGAQVEFFITACVDNLVTLSL